MLKEIYEQPEALENAMRGRLDDERSARAHFGGLNLDPQQLRQAERIILTACGTSYHAALVGEYLFEEFARIPVEVEYASEFRYRNPPIDRNTIVAGDHPVGRDGRHAGGPARIETQGTSDACAVQRRRQQHRPRGRRRRLSARRPGDRRRQHQGVHQSGRRPDDARPLLRPHAASVELAGHAHDPASCEPCPTLMRADAALPRRRSRDIAQKYHHVNNLLYLGRQYLFPVALEGALKLKEISYIHAEGYPAAEMKHGPIALVDENTPSVFLMPRGGVFDKVMSNLEEIKARGGPVIAIACEGDEEVGGAGRRRSSTCRKCRSICSRSCRVVPLQLLAYHIALLRGCDVDKPRNLAKSVTVE